MNPATQYLESIAHLCASLQAPYATIAKAVEALGLKPAVTINGIGHYDADACERIAEHLAGKRSETT
jgi:hypothetical protein